jgi:hypothetical protein
VARNDNLIHEKGNCDKRESIGCSRKSVIHIYTYKEFHIYKYLYFELVRTPPNCFFLFKYYIGLMFILNIILYIWYNTHRERKKNTKLIIEVFFFSAQNWLLFSVFKFKREREKIELIVLAHFITII